MASFYLFLVIYPLNHEEISEKFERQFQCFFQIQLHCKKKLVKVRYYTGNFVASRILYNVQLTVLSIQLYFLHIKTVSFLHGCTAKIKLKLSVLRAYLVLLSYFFENYRDKLPFIICKSNPYNIVNIIIYKFPQ